MNNNQSSGTQSEYSILKKIINNETAPRIDVSGVSSLRHPASRNSNISLLTEILSQKRINQALVASSLNKLSNQFSHNHATISSLFGTQLPRLEPNQTLFAAKTAQLNLNMMQSIEHSNNALRRMLLHQSPETNLKCSSQDIVNLLRNSQATEANRIVENLLTRKNSLADELSSKTADAVNMSSIARESAASLQKNPILPHKSAPKPRRTSDAVSTPEKQQTIVEATQPVSPAMNKPGRPKTFITNLYQMLLDLEEQPGGRKIASFLPKGHAFHIHRPKEFSEKVIPQYFKMKSYASFQRQLNMYGFHQIPFGPERGAYHHERFIRGRPQLLPTLHRCISNGNKKGNLKEE